MRTVGVEILEDCDHVSTVYVPIGGGGLISGVGAAVKRMRPGVRIVGVEPEGGAAMAASITVGKPVTLERVKRVADGLLPVRPGDLTFTHVTEFVDDVITVKDEDIIKAVQWLMTTAKLVVEPSGAATVAAVLFQSGGAQLAHQGVTVAVLSGGNIAIEILVSLYPGAARVNSEQLLCSRECFGNRGYFAIQLPVINLLQHVAKLRTWGDTQPDQMSAHQNWVWRGVFYP